MLLSQLKQQIHQSIDTMNDDELRSAFIIIKEIKSGKQLTQIDKKVVDTKIEKGIAELNNGLGKDFGIFLNEAKAMYGSQK